MKILIISQWFASCSEGKILYPGGTERYAYGLYNQLTKNGHKVMVTYGHVGNVHTECFNGIHERHFQISEKFYGFCSDILAFIHTLKSINEFNPDVVHVISTRYRFSAGAIFAAYISKKKIVFTRTTYLNEQKNQIVSYLFDRYISKQLIRKTDMFIALSKESYDALKRVFSSSDVRLVPSFVMHSYFVESVKEKNTLLFVGRLDVLKGSNIAIDVLRRVKSSIPDIKLLIAGTGQCEDKLKERVVQDGLGDNVSFLGHLNDDELVQTYSKSEIFIFPSLSEGMPMALLESMSAKLPIVAFDIPPCEEALENGKNGILIPKGNIVLMADEIVNLLTDINLRKKYSKLAWEKSSSYQLETVVHKIESLYAGLLGLS